MGYKVYYDDIWAVDSEASKKCNRWSENINEVYKRTEAVIKSKSFGGRGAKSVKAYLQEVHGILSASLAQLSATYMFQIMNYYQGYVDGVDRGDGSKNGFGVRYTTIVEDEIAKNGLIPRKLDALISKTEDISNEANRICNSVSDLLSSYFPKSDSYGLTQALKGARSSATDLDSSVISYESSHRNDLADIDALINEVNSILNKQLSWKRVPIAVYRSGSIGSMCNVYNLINGMDACGKICTDFQKSGKFDSAVQLAFSRDQQIHEEEKYDRRWVKWLETGVAVVGSVVLIAVTAGGATPVACAIVGGVVGGTTVAVNLLGDNYIETGSLTEGMDWSNFAKKVLIGTATGAITGYFGANQFTNAASTVGGKIALNVTKNVTASVTGNIIETAWNVGEAIIKGEGADKVISVLEEGGKDLLKDALKSTIKGVTSGLTEGAKIGSALQQPITTALKTGGAALVDSFADKTIDLLESAGEIYKETGSLEKVRDCLSDGFKNVVRDTIASGASEFVGSYLESYFGIDPGKKGFWQKLGEETLTNISKTITKDGITTLWDVGDVYLGVLKGEKTIDDVTSVLEKSIGDFFKDLAEGEFKTVTSNITKSIDGKINTENWFMDAMAKTFVDSSGDVVSTIASAAIAQGVDGYLANGQFDVDFEKIWQEKFDEGKLFSDIVKGNAEKEFKAAIQEQVKMKLKDPETGEVVRMENGKIRYTTQNLKLFNELSAKDYDNDGMVEIVTFGDDESSGVLKEDYDMAVAQAGKGDYKDKTVQEMLGLSHDVDVSESKVTVNTVSIEEVSKSDFKIHSNAPQYNISMDQVKNNIDNK